MAIFVMIRHGENDLIGKTLAGRLPGVHLNETGIAQANHLAEELAKIPVKAVFSSPLERARETAAPIAQIHNLPVITHTGLMEIDFGTWQGKDFIILRRRKLWQQVQNRPGSVTFPAGENFAGAQIRISEALLDLAKKYQPKDLIVCVTHGDVIRLAVAYFLGTGLDNFQKLRISPASSTVLFINEGQVVFGPINHTFNYPNIKDI